MDAIIPFEWYRLSARVSVVLRPVSSLLGYWLGAYFRGGPDPREFLLREAVMRKLVDVLFIIIDRIWSEMSWFRFFPVYWNKMPAVPPWCV